MFAANASSSSPSEDASSSSAAPPQPAAETKSVTSVAASSSSLIKKIHVIRLTKNLGNNLHRLSKNFIVRIRNPTQGSHKVAERFHWNDP